MGKSTITNEQINNMKILHKYMILCNVYIGKPI
jgi:hypothetical protein